MVFTVTATGTGNYEGHGHVLDIGNRNYTGLKDGGCYMTHCDEYIHCRFGFQELFADQRGQSEIN